MKILYVGKFNRPWDTELYIARSFGLLGHSVVCVDSAGAIHPKENQRMLEKYDFVLFSKGASEEAIQFYKDRGVPTASWYFDLLWTTERQNEIGSVPIFKCDFVFSTDGGHNEEFKKAGINHHVLRQGIFSPEAHWGHPRVEWGEDIIFVGSVTHYQWFKWKHRTQLMQFLRDNYGERFKQHGLADEVRNLKLNDLIASSKIVMGDSVYSPNYWSNRIYETIGRGGFCIFPEIPGLQNEFKPYKHFVPYKIGDWEALKEKIDYYLKNDDERTKIQRAGFEHCKKYHTYEKRCDELIKIVKP